LEETLGFVIEYMHECQHVSIRVWDAKEEERVYWKIFEGAPTKMVLNPILQDLAHKYVLTNTEIMSPWI
jgi:hypothetical protein